MRRPLFIGGVTLGVLALAPDASAFCRSTTCRAIATNEWPTDESGCGTEGAKLVWASTCISYAVNELGTQDLDPEESRAVIRKAFQAWSDVPCGPDAKGGAATITFQERDPVSCKESEYSKDAPNVNVILFQDDDWKYSGIDGTLAKTSVTYNDDTGEIDDADIEVNSANNGITITDEPRKIEYDLQVANHAGRPKNRTAAATKQAPAVGAHRAQVEMMNLHARAFPPRFAVSFARGRSRWCGSCAWAPSCSCA